MEEQITTIQYQLWAMMALFIFVIITNIICYLAKRGEKRKDDAIFSLMWEKDELDQLVIKSEEYLRKYPNNLNALYFGAKALIVKKKYMKAKHRLKKLSEIEPAYKQVILEMLDEIKDLENK